MEQEHILDQITREEIRKPKRPIVVTVICIIYFCFVALLIPTFIINSEGIRSWSFLVVVVYLAITLTCIAGIWKMKKWGVYGFIALTGITLIITIALGNWSLRAFLIPTICSIILLVQSKKME
jgi:hypothetical protein